MMDGRASREAANSNQKGKMKKVLLYSMLLIGGLIVSQFLDGAGATAIRLATMVALSFIMIHVGLEFDLDKSRPRQYVWDYVVAGTAAAFPWVFCAAYFVFVMAPQELWGHGDLWREVLLEARFASPTSAGVLFSMLAAAGLAATWLFKKARVLAIFDDLDTILLMIPLKMMMVGNRWQLWTIVAFIAAMLWLAWRYLHVLRLPVGWKWTMLYSVVIVAVSELIYVGSKQIDASVPIHLEVLLPAFVLGCMLKPDHAVHHDKIELRATTVVSACFMVLVGLSMPSVRADAAAPVASPSVGLMPEAEFTPVEKKSVLAFDGVSAEVLAKKNAFPGWGWIGFHVLMITLISNIGKMFPAFCYRKEVSFRERLALSVCMFPRGEVGAGVLVISLSYGLGGPALTVAVLSLALNLLLTGVFIVIVKKLIGMPMQARAES
jgi:Kef-type K+ transport system membrane component KefB